MNVRDLQNRLKKAERGRGGFRVEFWEHDGPTPVKLVSAIGPPADLAAHVVRFDAGDEGY